MHWKAKALAFRLLDTVPQGHRLHYLLQRHVTKTWPRSRDVVEALAGLAKRNIELFRTYGSKVPGDATFLEIGAGRDLTVPLAMRALGAGRVISVDVERLAELDLINHSAGELSELLNIAIPSFDTFEDLEAYGVSYLAPQYVETLPVERGIDALVSNEVLEHIPEEQLNGILENLPGICAPDSIQIHSIDYSDHYARDGGVSRFNFLQYSDTDWAGYNSGFQFVNRLRHPQYVELFAKHGLEILLNEPHSMDMPEAVMRNLDEKFHKFSPEDLAVVRSVMVVRQD